MTSSGLPFKLFSESAVSFTNMDTKTLPSASQLRKDAIRATLFSLCDTCLVDDCNPVDCPLYAVRKLLPTQRLLWINTLSEDDLVYLATYHQVCMQTKLALKTAAIHA